MRLAWLCARATLQQSWLPLVFALVGTWAAIAALPPLQHAGPHADTSGMWLHLPCLVVSLTAILAALETWPLWSRDRLGAGILRQARPGGLDGCVPATLGTLAALAILLVATAVAFTGVRATLGTLEGEVRSYRLVRPAEDRPVIDVSQASLTVHPPAGTWGGFRLQPVAFAADARSAGILELWVTGDGEALHEEPIRVASTHQHVRIDFAPRRIERFEITRGDPVGMVLFFPEGSLEAIHATTHGHLTNAVLAALSYLFPVALALALATLGRHRLALPVGMAVGAVCLLLFLIADWMPLSNAVADYTSRRWLLTQNLLARGSLSLCMVLVVMVAARWTKGRRSP